MTALRTLLSQFACEQVDKWLQESSRMRCETFAGAANTTAAVAADATASADVVASVEGAR